MRLVLTPEQRELREAVRSFLAAASPPAKARDGYDPAVHARLNGELGLSGLIVPEEYGGAGAGMAELAVALEETGAALLPGPFLATAFAALALTRAPDKELLTGVAEGRIAATLALPLVPDGLAARAEGGAVTLRGTLPRVLSGTEADVLLAALPGAPAGDGSGTQGEPSSDDGTGTPGESPGGGRAGRSSDGGPVLVAVDLGGAGVTRVPLETLDLTRGQARVELDGAPARVLGRLGADGAAAVADLVAVALAAEQLGVLRASLDAIVAYAKIRVTFGRFIGSYQGVKHKLADMHCKLEQAESVVRHAAWAADEDPAELPHAAALAQAYVGRACFEVARDHLLLHGGVGFTWEHDAHLFYKRAKADEVLLGPPRVHRARLAALMEAGAPVAGEA
ncbi:acyl-CoA dehydrogenase family protein [Nonomuraea rhodomycinica]|uniref:Acyl-CoA/acyl-ACP dehydrogenase n=1 Tax=Nonomuraea rhodomycinica TaxID=1712872 RepID=A0A7Y6IR44_9ACTN|nr:acyl-CoA dehydrogenase family protein [Nonomuraea rhodomycinica]NUW42866.1 acyl-CoA/acyl-ACP dehydrogenase [Nonomuraea rhodomycinica]